MIGRHARTVVIVDHHAIGINADPCTIQYCRHASSTAVVRAPSRDRWLALPLSRRHPRMSARHGSAGCGDDEHRTVSPELLLLRLTRSRSAVPTAAPPTRANCASRSAIARALRQVRARCVTSLCSSLSTRACGSAAGGSCSPPMRSGVARWSCASESVKRQHDQQHHRHGEQHLPFAFATPTSLRATRASIPAASTATPRPPAALLSRCSGTVHEHRRESNSTNSPAARSALRGAPPQRQAERSAPAHKPPGVVNPRCP